MTSTTRLHPRGADWLRHTVEKRDNWATISFWLALLGLPLFGLTSLLAIVSGLLARRPRLNQRNNGSRLAKTGIVLGFAGLAGWVCFAIMIFGVQQF
jgi:hypothetical protein